MAKKFIQVFFSSFLELIDPGACSQKKTSGPAKKKKHKRRDPRAYIVRIYIHPCLLGGWANAGNRHSDVMQVTAEENMAGNAVPVPVPVPLSLSLETRER